MIFQASVIGKSDAFCNLPEVLVARIPNRTSAVIQFCWDGKNCDSQPHFVSWIGGVSNSDGLELPSSQFDSCKGSDTLRIEAVLTDIAEAEEVHFSPNSSYDWDIISTQAEIVERKLLMQLSIAYGGQTIRIYISPSLTVVLKCTNVKTRPASFPSSATQPLPSTSLYSEAAESHGDRCNYNAAVVPVKLCANTLAVVAPYTSSSNLSGIEKFGTGGDHKKEMKTSSKSVLSMIEEGSVHHCLRTLPQMFRNADTSHRSRSDIFDRCNEGSNNTKGLVINKSSSRNVDLMRDILADYSCEGNSLTDADAHQFSSCEDYSCLIHPSFIENSYQTALIAMREESGIDEEEGARVLNYKLNANYIGIVRINRVSDDYSAVKAANNLPLLDSIIVGVKLSCDIRPLHISLSSSTQKALGAQDYSSVQLRLLGTTGNTGENSFRSPIMPCVISLQPIEWRTSLGGEESNSKSDAQRKIGKHTPGTASLDSRVSESNKGVKKSDDSSHVCPAQLDAIRESFVRIFEKHHSNADTPASSSSSSSRSCSKEDSPLVIGHGCIVSLTHRSLDSIQHTDDSPSKFDFEASLDSTLSRRAKATEVVVDYLVGIHKSFDRDKVTSGSHKQSDASKKDEDIEDDRRNLAIDFIDDYCVIDSEEMLLDCLDVLVLGEKKVAFSAGTLLIKDEKLNAHSDRHSMQVRSRGSQSSAAILLADFDQQMPAISLSDVLSTNKTAATVTVDVLSLLLPTSVAGARGGRCPPLGSLLVGPRSSGKSTLCHGLSVFLRDSCRTVAHTEVLDCRELKGRPTKVILDRLSDIFQTAKINAPSFICLDNLDAICPAQPEGTSGVSSTQQRLVSLKLECLLADLSYTSIQNYKFLSKFIAQYEEMCQDSEDCVWGGASVSRTENNRGANSACSMLSPDSAVCEIDSAVGRVLRDAVYVLATAESAASIHPNLICQTRGSLRIVLAMKPLGNSARLSILRKALRHYGCPLEVLTEDPATSVQKEVESTLSQQDFSAVAAATEGLQPGDIWKLCKRLSLYAARRGRGTEDVNRRSQWRSSSVLYTTAEEVVSMAKEHPPSSSSSSSSSSASSSTVSWQHIGGLNAAKTAITDIFQLPVIFRRLFQLSPIRMPRAMLLYGPPGCGKTILAQAAANECGLAFISVRGPELLNKYIGASEKSVRDLFERARGCGKPCIIFFDEFEALAPKRGKDNTGVTDRVVNQLLTLIDGADASMGGVTEDSDDEGEGGKDGGSSNQVFILAATSRPDLIDVALLRPGRVEKHVYIGFPDRNDKIDIMKVTLRQLNCLPTESRSRSTSEGGNRGDNVFDEVLESISNDPKSALLTPADLTALVKSAFLMATQDFIDGSDMSSDPSVCILQSSHLLKAFQQTRSSISEADRAFYDNIYSRFRQSSNGPAQFPQAEASASDLANQRTTLV